MTPEQLAEIESRWYIAPDFQLMFAAVREAWAERDEAKKKLELKEIELP